MSSDEDVIIDHDPSEEHPQVLSNNNVPILWKAVSYVWSIFEEHGYLIALGAVITYYLYQKSVKYLEHKVNVRKSNGQSNLSPEEQMNKLEKLRKVREKQQAEVDKLAAVEAVKMKEREEQQRQDKIEDWERHKQGQGYRSKTKASQPSSSVKSSDFNPMMGSGGTGGGFRSNRPSFNRGGGGGGGGGG